MVKRSLVIPCYNEAANLPEVLSRCRAVTAAGAQVVLVDNGSQDETPRILADLLPDHPGCRAVRVEENQDYGGGILTGLRAADGDLLGWTHADLQTDPADAVAGFALFEQVPHPERLFVKGRRHGRPPVDVLFEVGMSVFETMLMGVSLWDINAQPTLMHRSFFETWKRPPNDFSLDLYAYFRARREAIEIRRFPVFFGERTHGRSHWNVDWRSKLKFIRRTMEYSIRLRLDR